MDRRVIYFFTTFLIFSFFTSEILSEEISIEQHGYDTYELTSTGTIIHKEKITIQNFLNQNIENMAMQFPKKSYDLKAFSAENKELTVLKIKEDENSVTCGIIFDAPLSPGSFKLLNVESKIPQTYTKSGLYFYKVTLHLFSVTPNRDVSIIFPLNTKVRSVGFDKKDYTDFTRDEYVGVDGRQVLIYNFKKIPRDLTLYIEFIIDFNLFFYSIIAGFALLPAVVARMYINGPLEIARRKYMPKGSSGRKEKVEIKKVISNPDEVHRRWSLLLTIEIATIAALTGILIQAISVSISPLTIPNIMIGFFLIITVFLLVRDSKRINELVLTLLKQ